MAGRRSRERRLLIDDQTLRPLPGQPGWDSWQAVLAADDLQHWVEFVTDRGHLDAIAVCAGHAVRQARERLAAIEAASSSAKVGAADAPTARTTGSGAS